MLNTEQKYILEDLIDKTSVSQVLLAISEICQEKAKHIRYNWQDTALSRVWEKAGNKLIGFYANL